MKFLAGLIIGAVLFSQAPVRAKIPAMEMVIVLIRIEHELKEIVRSQKKLVHCAKRGCR